MSKRIAISLACAGLLFAACGGPGSASEETTSTLAPTTTSLQPTTSTPTTTTTTTTETNTTQSSEVASLMAALQESSAALTSGRIEGSVEMTGMDEETTGLSEAVILFRSSFNTTTGDVSFLMDMSSFADSIDPEELADSEDPFAGMAAAFLGEIEFRQIGDRVFLKFPFFTAMFGAETDWISMPAEEGSDFTNTFETVPSNPSEVLEAYEGAAATLENLGTETVNGVEATHYRISLNAGEMDLTPAEREELEASGLFADGVIPMDIWVSEDAYTVRMILEIDGTGLDAPPEERFETMSIRYDLIDINEDITIEPPPASEVTDIEDLEGSFFGFETEG